MWTFSVSLPSTRPFTLLLDHLLLIMHYLLHACLLCLQLRNDASVHTGSPLNNWDFHSAALNKTWDTKVKFKNHASSNVDDIVFICIRFFYFFLNVLTIWREHAWTNWIGLNLYWWEPALKGMKYCKTTWRKVYLKPFSLAVDPSHCHSLSPFVLAVPLGGRGLFGALRFPPLYRDSCCEQGATTAAWPRCSPEPWPCHPVEGGRGASNLAATQACPQTTGAKHPLWLWY